MNISKQKLLQIIREEIQAVLEEAKKKSDKDRMKCNKSRRIRKGEAGYGKKKFVVKACDGGTERIIRYGDANMEIKKRYQIKKLLKLSMNLNYSMKKQH